ncbi:YihY/virulence factor BrkB family protein [Plantactinospora sp. WMMB334]|uniref:YihY/virulence factor BrkB family protein n=1 Tax=Plantactinospora sp. WMMB334 TaxID=3404119 RepID=UPI003B9293C9
MRVLPHGPQPGGGRGPEPGGGRQDAAGRPRGDDGRGGRTGSLRHRMRSGGLVTVQLGDRAVRRALRHRIHGLAAEASFWTMLSMPPLLLALLGLIGQLEGLLGPGTAGRVATAILRWADGVFTDQTMGTVIGPLVESTLREGDSGVVSVGLILALWSGSAALSNYVTAITLAYGMDGLRSFWRTRLLSLALYLAALVIGVVLLPLLVLGPELLERLLAGVPGPDLAWLVPVAYWPVVLALSIAALTSLYHVAVPTRTRWRRDLPGAVLALLIWVAGSAALRGYLASSLRTDTGPAAAPIAVLIFFFVTALAVLIGAEVNAAVDARWPDRSTQEGRRDARERRRDARERHGEPETAEDEPETAADEIDAAGNEPEAAGDKRE